MSKNVDYRQLHDRAQPNGRARVVAEDQELRAERAELRGRESIENGVHRVLADAEVQIASAIVFSAEVAGAVEGEARFRRW